MLEESNRSVALSEVLHLCSHADVETSDVLQESEVQAEYDNVLREAKLLRLDLQHALTKCLDHKVGSLKPATIISSVA